MSEVFINSIIAAMAISLLSLVGVFTFALKKDTFNKISMFLVAFSTGALLGGAFLHLLPESISKSSDISIYIYVLIGIFVFYILERFLRWRHCHDEADCAVHTFTHMSLIGDSIHNFIDGLIIISAFYVNPGVGVATSVAIASHEIPQELGDFGVLVHGGFSKNKALMWNAISATASIFGVIIGFFLINAIENISLVLLPFAAGGLIYVSMSDLIPELHKENSLNKSIINISLFMLGLIFMYFTKIIL